MRSRNGTGQDPQAVRELAALDAALSGGSVDPELRELAELAQLLLAERPQPRPDFIQELDSLVSKAFVPAEPVAEVTTPVLRERRLTRIFAHRHALTLAIGAAASVFIVATAVLSSGVLSSRDQVSNEQRSGGRPEAVPAAGPTSSDSAAPLSRSAAPGAGSAAPKASGSPSVTATPAPARVTPHARSRKVERAASLTLAPPGDKVEDVADEVIQIADRYRGFVLRSTISGGDAQKAGGSLDLRIPSDRLQPAIRDLSGLAHVRSRTQNAQDVTGTLVSRRNRLNEALAERRALLRQLARADTPNETASIRGRLRLANQNFVAARRSLHALENRISYAALEVELEPDYSVSGGGGSTLGDAFDDAGSILGTSLAIALVSFAVLLPLSIFLLLGWVTVRRIARQGRERALDEAL